MSHRLIARAAASAAVLSLVIAPAGMALAAGTAFDVTVAGVANRGTVTNLPATSEQPVDIANLPAGVGLYLLHCARPTNPMAPPTRCDAGAGSLVYVVATGELRPALRETLRVNAAFEGKNPNPTTGDTGSTAIDCRSQACAIYTLGAGRESANPAYIRVFMTQFSTAGTKPDSMTVYLKNRAIKQANQFVVHYKKADRFRVTLQSGLSPELTSDNCRIADGTIRALKKTGTCKVTVTSPGDATYAPFTGSITFKLRN